MSACAFVHLFVAGPSLGSVDSKCLTLPRLYYYFLYLFMKIDEIVTKIAQNQGC